MIRRVHNASKHITDIIRDMTSSEKLQGSALTAALENVTDAVIMIDAFGRIAYRNFAAAALIESQHPGMPAEFLDTVFSRLDKSADSEICTHEVTLRGGAQPIAIEFTATPVHRQADYAGAVVVFRDVSHRGASELALQTREDSLLADAEALFEERERAQVTLNSIGDAVISTDFRGRVIYVNRVAEKITGWAQAEASGRLLDEICVLRHSTTRAQIPCPTTRAIIDDCTVRIDAECSLIRRDGAEIAVEASASPIHDTQGGVVGAVLVARDVTAARDLTDRLARLALYDVLTDLPNRALFADRLDQALVRAARSSGVVTLLFIDLDGFKPVNDSFGHAAGDLLLKAVAHRLLTCVRGTDTVSRHGGDEFIILLTDLENSDCAAVCASKVKVALAAPFPMGAHEVRVTASIGIASFPEHATDGATLLKCADTAMYRAKAAGRNTYQLFTIYNA